MFFSVTFLFLPVSFGQYRTDCRSSGVIHCYQDSSSGQLFKHTRQDTCRHHTDASRQAAQMVMFQFGLGAVNYTGY